MLLKGLVIRRTSEEGIVWSEELNRDVIIKEDSLATGAHLPALGQFIAFTFPDNGDANYIRDFTEIPPMFETRIVGESVQILTEISFSKNDILIAASSDVGLVLVLKNFPQLQRDTCYVAWIARIPQSAENVAKTYNVSWCVETLLKKRSPHSKRRSLASHDCGEDSLKKPSVSDKGKRSEPRQMSDKKKANSSESECEDWHTFEIKPVKSALYSDNIPKRYITGLVTMARGQIAYIWSSDLGDGLISDTTNIKGIKIGVWVKFIPAYTYRFYTTWRPNLLKYIALKCSVIEPLYPVEASETTVTVAAKLFVPRGYRYNKDCLWAEYFGAIEDEYQVVANFMKRCELGVALKTHITISKSPKKGLTRWIVTDVSSFLKPEKSFPSCRSPSFVADALRFLVEEPKTYNAILEIDKFLPDRIKNPHSLVLETCFTNDQRPANL